MKTITLEVSDTVYALLEVITRHDNSLCSTVEEVIYQLIDHAQQGVYRPGAWERQWLASAFTDDWIKELEPGDPYGREGCDDIFQRPRRR